jgi:hypothetical protein
LHHFVIRTPASPCCRASPPARFGFHAYGFTDLKPLRVKMGDMSKGQSLAPSPSKMIEQKIARRIAICMVFPFATIWLAVVRIAREPRNAWRLIRMDALIQIQVAKDAWTRW